MASLKFHKQKLLPLESNAKEKLLGVESKLNRTRPKKKKKKAKKRDSWNRVREESQGGWDHTRKFFFKVILQKQQKWKDWIPEARKGILNAPSLLNVQENSFHLKNQQQTRIAD